MMNNNYYYYNVSMFDLNTNEWTNLKDNEEMNCENAHRAISLLNILYRNDMMERPDYYKELAIQKKVIKWTIFRVPINEDGDLDYNNKRFAYSIASDYRVKARRYITIKDVLL